MVQFMTSARERIVGACLPLRSWHARREGTSPRSDTLVDMATALDTIAHVILPNVMKLKGASVVMSAMERRDVALFAHVWEQTGVKHTPQVVAKEHDAWRIGVMSLPTPNEMGEAFMCAFIAKKQDAAIARYFTLENDYVLATKTHRTQLCERDGSRMVKLGDGPVLGDDFSTNANAFIAAIVGVLTK